MKDLTELLRQKRGRGRDWPVSLRAPCFSDWFQGSGVASGQYFHQDLLIAQRVFVRGPRKHVDVGSRIDGFVAHVASFREIEVLDIRELVVSVRNIRFRQCDVMALPRDLFEYCDSLSCLHALEHFGLGRYNDPVNYEGYAFGFANLVRLLQPGGVLYLSVPIGPQRIEFNGHRVFSVSTILSLAQPTLSLERLHCVDDAGDLHECSLMDSEGIGTSFGVNYGCAIFEFVKRQE